MSERQPISYEQAQQVQTVDNSERDYFKNLSNRLLARAGFNMTVYPVGMVLINNVMKNVNFLDLANIPVYNPLLDGVISGVTAGAALTAMDIWNLRHAKLPADASKSEPK